MSEIMILAVCFQLNQLKKQSEKNFRLEQDSNPWPCDTGVVLYPLSYQATWIDGQLWVRHIPDDSEYIYKYEYMKISLYVWTADKHKWNYDPRSVLSTKSWLSILLLFLKQRNHMNLHVPKTHPLH